MNVELQNFIDLSYHEKIIVLEFRNNSSIRKWMYDSNEIMEKNHLNFIDNLKNNKNNKYFLVKKDNQNVGVIYFNNIGNTICNIGLYSNPKLKGVGSILMETICKYAFIDLNIDILHIDVFLDNEKAIKLYKQFNFQEMNQKTSNSKEILLMELRHENR